MKVCVSVLPQRLSRAMHRVAGALARHAPAGVTLVERPRDADLQVIHVIGRGSIDHLEAKRYAVLQYCYATTEPGADPVAWADLWAGADAVWSYYDLADAMPPGVEFYHAPLGVDPAFCGAVPVGERDVGIVTSGYVAGEEAEAIEEAAVAASLVGLKTCHVGPSRVLAEKPHGWKAVSGLLDEQLAALYGRARWVSGLRHVEGFELPAAEGLACGARPILFDRPEMRRWYGDSAVYVPECSGPELVESLRGVLTFPPKPVQFEEREAVLRRFDWRSIAEGFWSRLVGREEAAA